MKPILVVTITQVISSPLNYISKSVRIPNIPKFHELATCHGIIATVTVRIPPTGDLSLLDSTRETVLFRISVEDKLPSMK